VIKALERAIDRYEASLDAIIVGGWQVFSMIAILIVVVGQIRSCVTRTDKHPEASPPTVVLLDLSIEKHKTLAGAFSKVLGDGVDAEVGIVQSDEVNAASFGNGRFLIWEGLADLPSWAIEAILAHEYSHDKLLHSVKAQDLHDFTAFWSGLVGVVGHADVETADVINTWGRNLVMPRYSKAQELEADDGAVARLRELGYPHPERTFADSLQMLLAKYGDSGGKFLDSHPATSERIRRVEAQAEK